MHIKYFVDALDNEEAISKVKESLSAFNEITIKIDSVESYYKFENVYMIELTTDIEQDMLSIIFDLYSDSWISFDNEYLASKTNPDCKYMRNGFEMIQIYV